MDADKEERYADFPVFKGLQKPLEFMGFQGRYIYWAAGTAGGAIVGFIIAYCLLGFVVGLVALVFAISTGAAVAVALEVRAHRAGVNRLFAPARVLRADRPR